MTRNDIIMRTIVDLPQEQIRKLTLFCRREKISRAEAVRRAVDRLLAGSPVGDLRSFSERPARAEIFRVTSPDCVGNGASEAIAVERLDRRQCPPRFP
jgi:Ribbon-helix-helix protein, copG family